VSFESLNQIWNKRLQIFSPAGNCVDDEGRSIHTASLSHSCETVAD